MSTFKNIEKLGIDLLYAYQCDRKATVIHAEDLEALLQSAPVVYGTNEYRPDEYEWSTNRLSTDTHSALLIGKTPLKKKTKAEAALEFIQKVADREFTSWSTGSVAEEAKRILEMKDEV